MLSVLRRSEEPLEFKILENEPKIVFHSYLYFKHPFGIRPYSCSKMAVLRTHAGASQLSTLDLLKFAFEY